jgi:hypothetical protein
VGKADLRKIVFPVWKFDRMVITVGIIDEFASFGDGTEILAGTDVGRGVNGKEAGASGREVRIRRGALFVKIVV